MSVTVPNLIKHGVVGRKFAPAGSRMMSARELGFASSVLIPFRDRSGFCS